MIKLYQQFSNKIWFQVIWILISRVYQVKYFTLLTFWHRSKGKPSLVTWPRSFDTTSGQDEPILGLVTYSKWLSCYRLFKAAGKSGLHAFHSIPAHKHSAPYVCNSTLRYTCAQAQYTVNPLLRYLNTKPLQHDPSSCSSEPCQPSTGDIRCCFSDDDRYSTLHLLLDISSFYVIVLLLSAFCGYLITAVLWYDKLRIVS